jgi:hypothetical protein
MKTLKLFNAVLAKKVPKSKRVVVDAGYVIEANAAWAQNSIQEFYNKEALAGRDLNKTFHKSWATIKNSTRGELLLEQIRHYASTYGTDFQGDIYIPDELVRVPGLKVVFKVVRGLSKAELTKKALGMLQSGVALKEETIDDVLWILTDLGYHFTGKENIRNNEAIVKIADLYGIIPADFMGFFRYILFRATGSTLIIKNLATVAAIKASTYNPDLHFGRFGLEELAKNFNRFKPLFLAFKAKCPATINEISRLSKRAHVPMVSNPLNAVTSRPLTKKDSHWLENATPYALFKALSALINRSNGQSVFMYKVRNGKSYVKEGSGNFVKANIDFILKHLKGRISLKGTKIFIPKDVVYAVPTSEKMYVGNIPMGTKFLGPKLAVGVYWKNAGGAHDIDLSGLSAGGKTGWNASYGRGGSEHDGLMYSGDITSAPNGAVEYLYAQRGVPGPTLVLANIYSGNDDATFKIIVGAGDNIDKKFMMDPNKLFVEATVQAVQKQSVIGLLIPDGKSVAFVVFNLGAGSSRVSGYNDTATLARVAMVQEWRNALSFNDIVVALGAELVSDPRKATIDLSLNKLEKDSFIKLFAGSPRTSIAA